MNNIRNLGYILFFFFIIIYVLYNQRLQDRVYYQETTEELNYQLNETRDELILLKDKTSNLRLQVTLIDNAVQVDSKTKIRVKLLRDVIRKETKKLSLIESNQLATEIIVNAEEFDVDPALIMAVIKQESNFDTQVVSTASAQGLMQIFPPTAKDIKRELNQSYYNPYKIAHNIKFGTFYLGKLLHEYNFKTSDAIMAYNAGPEAVKKGFAYKYAETINYEKKVLDNYKYYQELGVQ